MEQALSIMESCNAKRILVVDDNIGLAKITGWTFEALGHEVMLAHDGLEAIDKACSFLPDVILLDIVLPKMDGYQACIELRRKKNFHHTMIIAQTTWGEAEHYKRSKEVGFNHHLVKPIDILQLQRIFSTMS